jgi:hypothetical protein
VTPNADRTGGANSTGNAFRRHGKTPGGQSQAVRQEAAYGERASRRTHWQTRMGVASIRRFGAMGAVVTSVERCNAVDAPVRAGLHTGEVEHLGGNMVGIACKPPRRNLLIRSQKSLARSLRRGLWSAR